ncbi:hypothetical protein V8C86DRAFT_2637170 [Haematococcus lacustris]
MVRFGPAVHVPEKEQQAEVELVPAAVVAVPSRLASTLIKAVASILPDTELRHLKRARKSPGNPEVLQLFLCKLEPQKASDTASWGMLGLDYLQLTPERVAFLPDIARSLLVQHQLMAEVLLVPSKPAQTREKWEEWSTLYWPSTWKVPNGKTVPLPEDLVLPAAEQAYFATHMAALALLADASAAANAARLVDPTTRAVIGQAVEASNRHPLHHAVLAAVQEVAQRDLEMWPPGSSCHTAPPCPPDRASTEAAELETGSQSFIAQSSSCTSPECGAAAAGSQACKRQCLRTAYQLGHGPEQSAVQSGPHSAVCTPAPEAVGLKPYLCTGLDCFVLQEPCAMCAMALVHSRLARVVYSVQDPVAGALGGCRHLMAERSLNHHYKVYRLPLLVGQQQRTPAV